MNQKNTIIALGIAILLVGAFFIGRLYKPASPQPVQPTQQNQQPNLSQCRTGEMIFYYLPQCHWCQKVKGEGTIEKLEQLGVKVASIDASNRSQVKHQFQGVPTFVINGEVLTGYRTFDELKELLGCPKEETAK